MEGNDLEAFRCAPGMAPKLEVVVLHLMFCDLGEVT